MTYDFTTIMDRRGKDSIACDMVPYPNGDALVQEGFSKIPMWVADMNFATCPTIQEEIIKRVQHPAFGYYRPTDEYFNGIINWHKTRNGVEGMTKENIGYENSVLGGVIAAMSVLASQGDNVLLHSPTYVGFTGCLKNAGYNIVHSPLVQDEEGIWRMDYEDMEKKIVANKIHVCVMCNPHNPMGRVWDKEELLKAMEVFEKHQVWVISDEIWSDLVLYKKHCPTQSVNEYAKMHTVAQYAPSKTFNLAGMVGSYHVCYNPWLNDRITKQSSLAHYNSMNVLWMHAMIGAYKPEGHVWVDELCATLRDNVDYAVDYIHDHFKGVAVTKPEGTYMLYIDMKEWLEAHGKTVDDVLKAGYSVGVIWQDGRPFHNPNAIRINLALPTSLVKEAFDRLDKYVFNAE